MAAGKSGTPGAVTCSTSSCDQDTEPEAKQCPKTEACGTFESDVLIVNRDSHPQLLLLRLLHHHCSQPSCSNHHKLLANPPKYAYTIVPICPHHFDTAKTTINAGSLVKRFFVGELFNTPTLLGNWKQAEPSGCATKCGVAAGKSGTPGAVTCDSSSCDAETKPAAKQCPKTDNCGTFGTEMSILHRDPHRLLLLPSSSPLLHHSSSMTSTSTQHQFNTRTRDPEPSSPY